MSLLIKGATLHGGKRSDILIEGDRIVKVAPSITAPGADKLDASRKIALPGLINTHTHAAMTLFRGIAEDMELPAWLATVRAAEMKVSPSQIRAGSALACLEMIKSGTTCFSDMYFHMDDVAHAVSDSGMRAVLGYSMVDIGNDGFDEKKRKSELTICERFIKDWQGEAEGRITTSVPPHSIYLCSKELLAASREMSDKHKVPLHIHLAETRKEVFDSLEKHRLRPASYLESLGVLSPRTVAAHCVWLTKEEVRLLSHRGVSAALCPVSNMKLAGGSIAPLPEMLEAKMNVSLGTDGAASNNSLSLLETMKTLALLVKNSRWDAKAAPVSSIISAATSGGARALGLESGALEHGKLADIILIDRKAANMAPVRSVGAAIVYSAHPGNVTDSVINGKIVMQDGKLLTLDEEKVVEHAEREAEKLAL